MLYISDYLGHLVVTVTLVLIMAFWCWPKSCPPYLLHIFKNIFNLYCHLHLQVCLCRVAMWNLASYQQTIVDCIQCGQPGLFVWGGAFYHVVCGILPCCGRHFIMVWVANCHGVGGVFLSCGRRFVKLWAAFSNVVGGILSRRWWYFVMLWTTFCHVDCGILSCCERHFVMTPYTLNSSACFVATLLSKYVYFNNIVFITIIESNNAYFNLCHCMVCCFMTCSSDFIFNTCFIIVYFVSLRHCW